MSHNYMERAMTRSPRSVSEEVSCSWLHVAVIVFSLVAAMLVLAETTARADVPAGKSDLFLTRKMACKPTSGWSSVIVKLDGDLASKREAQLKSLGGYVYRHLPIVQSVAVRVPNRSLSRLASLPYVQRLSADVTVKKCDEFIVGSSGADVAFQQYGLNGYGVTVAVIDTGVHFSNDLADTVKGGSSRIIGKTMFGPTNTDDFCGHGTHVAGIIAGNGAASTGSQYFRTFYGIARDTNLVNVCALDKTGQGTVSNVIAGIQWVVTNKTKYNIRVLNLSLGHPVGESYTTDPLCQAVEQAWKAGIAVVCAAGNQGRVNASQTAGLDNEGWGTAYGSIQSPGNDPYVITVGAMKSIGGGRAYDRIATYSSRGPTRLDLVLKPDIVAPGNKVISLNTNNSYLADTYGATNLIPLSYYCYTTSTSTSDRYFCLSGTSMAAPVVSGAVALMLQANSKLSPDTVKARLMMSADKWNFPDGTADPCTFGAGYLNIPAALNCTVTATQYAMSPSMSQDSQGNVYINIDNALWGTKAIWGTGVTDLRAVWGTRAVWGSNYNILTGSKAIWGTAVWYDRAVWGTSSNAVDLSATAIYGE